MNSIPTYSFKNTGRTEKLVDVFSWDEPDLYQPDKPHCHEYHEIMIFEKGGGKHEIDFRTFGVKKYSFHIIPKGFVHSLARAKGSAGFTVALSEVFIEQLSRFDQTMDYHAVFAAEKV